MIEERFKAYLPSNMRKPHIKDKYDNCPICDYPFNTLKQAEEVAEWLNQNTIEYKRFVLIVDEDKFGKMYRVWDNEKNERVSFIPLIPPHDTIEGLKKYVDWLNSLVEE